MPPLRQSASRCPGLLQFFTLYFILFTFPALPAPAHVTLEFHATPTFAANPMFVGAPTVVHGIANAHLNPDSLTFDLTLADAAAYALLNPDPYTPPANATTSSATSPTVASSSSSPSLPSTTSAPSVPSLPPTPDPHFTADQSLLTTRAANAYLVISNGTILQPFATDVTLTPDQNIVFHLTYPRPPPGPLRFQANDLAQAPADQNDVLTVTDETGATLGTADLSAANPVLDLTLSAPAASAAAAPAHHHLILIAAAAIFLFGLFFLASRLPRRPPAQ